MEMVRIIIQYTSSYCICNVSGCACIPTVKKHALISEGVLIFGCFVKYKLVLSAWCAYIQVLHL